MAKPVKFAHVVYMTRRYDEMIAWYRDVFEAEVVYENPALAFLTYDDEHHRFAFANLDLLKPGGLARRPGRDRRQPRRLHLRQRRRPARHLRAAQSGPESSLIGRSIMARPCRSITPTPTATGWSSRSTRHVEEATALMRRRPSRKIRSESCRSRRFARAVRGRGGRRPCLPGPPARPRRSRPRTG